MNAHRPRERRPTARRRPAPARSRCRPRTARPSSSSRRGRPRRGQQREQDADAEVEAVEHDVERDGDADDRRPDQRQTISVSSLMSPPLRSAPRASLLRPPTAGGSARPRAASTSAGIGPLSHQLVDVIDADREHDDVDDDEQRERARRPPPARPASGVGGAQDARRRPRAGGRPRSTTQPARMAMKPTGHRKRDRGAGYQRASNSRPAPPQPGADEADGDHQHARCRP